MQVLQLGSISNDTGRIGTWKIKKSAKGNFSFGKDLQTRPPVQGVAGRDLTRPGITSGDLSLLSLR
jgi:hypothetical protein